jgi:hypothetical protein
MRAKSWTTHVSIVLTASLAAAFCAETYVSSGWNRFSHSLKPYQPPSASGTASHSERDDNLRKLISRYLNCKSDANQKVKASGSRPFALSLWLSPYRQFPEAPPEGSGRGKGDYEYFSYIADGHCGRIASNYGAFKKSPADQTFSRASRQGIRAELLLAKKLGYDAFVLDANKTWLTTSDRDLCKQNRESCRETSDGFIFVNLKDKTRLAEQPTFLRTAVRMGIGTTLAESLENHSFTAARASQWYAWESPEPGTALRWSNATNNPGRSIELLTPAIGGGSPANLRTLIVANPSVKTLLLELICTQGKQQQVRLTVQTSKDISKLASSCLPKSIRILRAIDQDGLIMPSNAPLLAKNDSREAWLGIMYDVN